MISINRQPDSVNIKKRNRWILVSLIFRASLLGLILVAVYKPGGSDRQIASIEKTQPDQSKVGSAEKLPSGVNRSDWNGILEAHQAWKHSIKADGKVWRAHNPGTGLTATFDGRGFEVMPESADWSWGLELVSYGRGDQQVSVGNKDANVSTTEQQIHYQWDGNLREWMKNDIGGFEHGCTIKNKPASVLQYYPLVINMKVVGSLKNLKIDDRGRAVSFSNDKHNTQIIYSNITVMDSHNNKVDVKFISKNNDSLSILIEDKIALYPLTIDPIIKSQPQIKKIIKRKVEKTVFNESSAQGFLKASNAEALDNFGYAVAMFDDTVVVGAPYDDYNNSVIDSGAVYIFVRGSSGWSQQAVLYSGNEQVAGYFGNSVAIYDDTVVVGAYGEMNSGIKYWNSPRTGAVYVFTRSGNYWGNRVLLASGDTFINDDHFGNAVAIYGDTIVVGAMYEDSSATGVNGDSSNNNAQDSGAVYVFVRSGSAWSKQSYLKASNAAQGHNFGSAVAITADTIVVGAVSEWKDINAGPSGAVYVFVRNVTNWDQQAYLKASNAQGGDSFGVSVAIYGDTLVVGAIGESRACY